MGFLGGSADSIKNLPAKAGDVGLISGSGRFPGEGNGNPLQYSCLENPMDRGAWWATAQGVTRVKPNLVTKPPKRVIQYVSFHIWLLFLDIMFVRFIRIAECSHNSFFFIF